MFVHGIQWAIYSIDCTDNSTVHCARLIIVAAVKTASVTKQQKQNFYFHLLKR